MIRYLAPTAAILLLVLNGTLHGIWSHRWVEWDDRENQLAVAKLEQLPLQIGDWQGERIKTESLNLPEELVGKGLSTRYVNQTDRTTITVYLAYGPTDSLVSHSPTACYPSNGFTWLSPDRPAYPPLDSLGGPCEFSVSQFEKRDGLAETRLRVFWSFSDGNGWQVPGNARRTFRHHPAIFKCYFIRSLVNPNEPVDGDPCFRLMAALLPSLKLAKTD